MMMFGTILITLVTFMFVHRIAECYNNLAFDKQTWQTNEKYPSSNAVDGQYRNQCAVSLESKSVVMWLVDLDAIQSIHKVVIHYRTDGKPFANSDLARTFLGFSVYVSNTTIKEDGILCYHDTTYTPSTIPSTVTIQCSMSGRYVIYFNTREGGLSTKSGYSTKAQINLCEVEVYGCPLGSHGVDFSKTCPINCHHCSIVSGECLGGCRNGFSGKFCDSYDRINMALHQPTYQLHTLFGGQPSSRLVDGKKSDLNIYHGQCTSTKDGQSFVMWMVDLQKYRKIERIVVYSRTDNAKWDVNNEFTRRFLGFSIAVSNTTDYNDGIICYHEQKYNKYTIPPVIEIFCSVVGRYVIYYNERRPGISYPKDYSRYAFGDLCEIEVYGCPMPWYGFEGKTCTLPCLALCRNDLQNLSYKKQTWLSSPFFSFVISDSSRSSSGSSDKAVDGRYTSRDYSSGQCAISKPSTTIVWWVNLGNIYRIDHVVIYFRTDNVQWGIHNGYTAVFLGFSLFISNTTSRHDGVLCHHDTTYTRQTILDHVSIDCPYSGQYVIYYNERLPGVTYPPGYSRLAYGDLCEVEVYGCPSLVVENPQCSRPCPSNCEHCYPATGLCAKCMPGFQGYACEIPCQATGNFTVSAGAMYSGSVYDALLSSKGISYPSIERGHAYINLTLSEKSSNIAGISFTLHQASNAMVTLLDSNRSVIKKILEHSSENQEWNVQVLNNIVSKIAYISVTVVYKHEFTISNLRLPLRICENDK